MIGKILTGNYLTMYLVLLISHLLLMRFSCFVCAFYLLACLACSAQEIPLGTWRTHACYKSAKQVVVGKEGTFCATANGLFLLEKNGQTLTPLSKIQGFTGAIPAQISYDLARNTLLIAYQDRTIDVLEGNVITEIPLLRQASFPNNPQINQIVATNNFTYLAADFGVALLDVGKREIKETYRNLGNMGSELSIQSLTFSKDSLILATAQGIIIGALTSNLADFQQWKRFGILNGLPPQKIRKVVTRQNSVYALTDNNQLFKYNHLNNWAAIPLPVGIYTDLSVGQTELFLTAASKLYTLDINDVLSSKTNALLQTPQAIQQDAQGTIWIADTANGLLSFAQNTWNAYAPNSPNTPNAWQARYTENKIVVTTGGFSSTFTPLQRTGSYDTFSEGTWTSTALPAVTDLTSYAYINQDKSQYFGSYGTGLWWQKTDGSLTQFTQVNSPLQASALNDVRITDLATDAQGTLWIANHAVTTSAASIHARQTNGTWQSYLPPHPAGRNPLQILIAQNGWKWIRLSAELGGGIWVLDEKNNRSRWLSSTPNQGNLPSNYVGAIVEDHDGLIWVGTDKGIAIFYAPEQIFGIANALLPIFEGRPVLRAEKVNSLVVDGGNRKWAGTDTGLWLLGIEGTSLVHYFNTANSPLPSNVIQNLVIHPKTGELFAITPAGIVSYRGTATASKGEYSDISVFPNPVYPHFDGLVGISGLPTGAKVKITDTSGRLFYETEAQGGTATWNLQDYTGTRAKAGIYLIYTFKIDGSKAKVLKIAVLE